MTSATPEPTPPTPSTPAAPNPSVRRDRAGQPLPDPSAPQPARIELTLSKPPVGWFPKPTVVLAGRGQPAQWGVGTWQVEPGATIGVFLFNRIWRFGSAEISVGDDAADMPRTLRYRAPWMPFLPGRLDLGR